MRYVLVLLLLISVFINSACRKDFDTIPSYGSLEFSKDTVFLDTIFSNIGSATYNLKVYNRGKSAITIPEIKLQNGNSSNYRLNVDGVPDKEFKNVVILPNDSIYVFIETTIDFSSVTDPLYTDKLLFDNGNNQQDVDLVTLVKDAHFIFPSKTAAGIETLTIDGKKTAIQGRFLKDSELNFTADKPYVIYGYAAVPANKTLNIAPGATLHFHRNSGLIADKQGSIVAKGTKDKKIQFVGDRLEHRFDRVPGQWGTIWLREGSTANEFEHIVIKNGIVGLLVDGLDATKTSLQIKNAEIYNNSSYGILGRHTSIQGENLVIGNTGQSSLACTFGGRYEFTHATFANFWNNSLRQLPAVIVNNHITYKDNSGKEITETRDLIKASFTNCIMTGNNNIEFIMDRLAGTQFNYQINSNLIQFNDLNGTFKNNNELNFNNTVHYSNIVLNKDAQFKDPSKSDFTIGKNSAAINKGIPTSVTTDILEKPRTPTIDLGAYQHSDF